MPTAVSTFGSDGVKIFRFLQGITQGVAHPSVHTLLGKWAPPQERSRLGVIACNGFPSGIFVTMVTSGYIASSWYGWPMVFYVMCGLGMIWSLLFSYLGSNSPSDHSSISREEKQFIEKSLSQQYRKKLTTPWKKIWTSPYFLALLFTQCGYDFGFYMLLMEIPIYFNGILKFNIKSNGTLSMLPYVAKCILAYVFGCVSDFVINKNICTLGTSRKIMHAIGSLMPCIALIYLGNCSKQDVKEAVICVIMTIGFLGADMSGFWHNHIDLSPNHAGILIGMANQISHLFAVLGPSVAQYVVTDEEDPSQWKIIFFLTAAAYASTTIVFTLFGSGDVQPWNDEKIVRENGDPEVKEHFMNHK
ncbi:hypothetical protein JTB14_000198 [Gonioctena quinquepunctata]|nr:hypothetical protein JTB14_000198 [Gonioctena quinquepunctata]